ncbi:hypothetical protein [Streptomyces sp. FIT100]|uniref:hypothetical protein n=1 Tax=Streptomyces sp. FIT100 TaxID=2837956 RepID=UPI0021C6CFBA|nr:hypothetical protein [Streptomyces sp. FIT100]UUN28845.1 hypothetical protein KK483_22505 [Streptomyces sp. FIT100]
MVLGTGLVALGYAHTLAYGFAVSHPTEVCGQRTLDADFPLTRTRVDVFPPRLECYWADSSAYGASHPTAAGGWLIWIGAALLVAGVVAWAVQLHSRMPRWARAGVILAPAVAAAIWITRVDRFMDLSTVDLRNECFSLQVAHLHSAPAGEVVSTDRSLLPPAVDCVFTDGTTSLILIETLGLWCCLAVFLVCCAMFLRRTAEAAVGGHEPR